MKKPTPQERKRLWMRTYMQMYRKQHPRKRKPMMICQKCGAINYKKAYK